MGDRGDQLGVTALGAAAGLGVAQRDDDAADGPGGRGAYVARGDEHLASPGEQQIPLGLSDADREAAVRVGQLPPATAFEVLQGKGRLQVASEGRGGGDGGDTGGGGVEADDPAVLVGDDESVGQVVGVDTEFVPRIRPGTGTVIGVMIGVVTGVVIGIEPIVVLTGARGRGCVTHVPCARCALRTARADTHPRTPPLVWRSGPPSPSPY